MVICLVGLSGSGKSYVSRLLCNYNERFIHLDVDKLGHEALQDFQIKEKLIEIFGNSILDGDVISRSKLGHIVFNSAEAMEFFNNLVWQYEEAKIDEFIALHPHNIIILDWLLVVKTKYFKNSDFRILVTAPKDVRMARAMARDNITAEKFLERDKNAPSINPDDFEYVINNVNLEYTKKEVEKIYDKSIVHRKF